MQLITLLTDFGLKDHRLATLKGQLYDTIETPFQIVDISHDVKAHDIVEAAFLFESAWRNFPGETIHVIWLYPGETGDMILARLGSHWMIAPDNGFLSLLADRNEMTLYRETMPGLSGTSVFQFIGQLCVRCLTGHLSGLERTQSIVERIALKPVFSKNEIRASFLYTDRFGNVYFNLRKEMFERIREGKSFKVFYRGMEPITKISEHYSDVAPGEMLCLFNAAGFFQISQSLGSANEALEIRQQDSIQILFYD